DRSFADELILRGVLRDFGGRVLPDQDCAVCLLLAVELTGLRQAHRTQIIRGVPGRHLPARNDIDQRPDALAIAALAGPAHESLRRATSHPPLEGEGRRAPK